MKIDRRHFLAFGIGGAVGTALSPLPWKLTDDLSIWTQNWPWVPVPPDGEYRSERSVCGLCPGGCGITVRMVADRPVKIEGRPGFPVNDGGICLLGLSGLQLLYSPSRIQIPMKRVGPRGSGQWEKMPWDAAVSEVADHLKRIAEKAEPDRLGCVLGSAEGTVPTLFRRFLAAFGSANVFTMPAMTDAQSLAMNRMHQASVDMGFDVENADFILSFGAGILEGWGAPVRMIRTSGRWRDQGVRVVQFEPRLSNTAAKADTWIAITPGTEAIVALGLAGALIRASAYDTAFIENRTRGFETFRERVLNLYTPERVEAATGVPAATLVQLAESFAKAKRPLALCGRGAGRIPGSLAETEAVYVLNALAGNLNRDGGVMAVPPADYIDWPEINTEKLKPRLDGAGSAAFPKTVCRLHRLPEIIQKSDPPALSILFVHGANPAHGLSDTRAVRSALEKIPLIVGFSAFMDETSQMADILLPDHHFLESYRDVPKPPGYCRPFIGLVRPVIPPQFDTQHVGDTLIQLAAAMGEEMADTFPWEDYETCLEETLGDKWSGLKETGFWEDTAWKPLPWDPSSAEVAGAFDFGIVTDLSDPVVPAAEGEPSAYPLLLVAHDSLRLAGGAVAEPPFMMKTIEDTVLKANAGFVEINPETAGRLGLSEGDAARIHTPKGEAAVRIHLFDGIAPGVLSMVRGLGHAGSDPYLSGKGVNVNDLLGPMEDPASGLDAAWGIRAKLVRA